MHLLAWLVRDGHSRFIPSVHVRVPRLAVVPSRSLTTSIHPRIGVLAIASSQRPRRAAGAPQRPPRVRGDLRPPMRPLASPAPNSRPSRTGATGSGTPTGDRPSPAWIASAARGLLAERARTASRPIEWQQPVCVARATAPNIPLCPALSLSTGRRCRPARRVRREGHTYARGGRHAGGGGRQRQLGEPPASPSGHGGQ